MTLDRRPGTILVGQTHVGTVVVKMHTFLEELIPQDGVSAHLGPYSNDTAHETFVPLLLRSGIDGVELLRDLGEVSVDLLQSTARLQVYACILGLRHVEVGIAIKRTWQSEIVTQHVDNEPPCSRVVNVGKEAVGDRVRALGNRGRGARCRPGLWAT